VAAPAKLRLRSHEDRFRLRVVMSRMAGKASQARFGMSGTQAGLVAHGAGCLNFLWRSGGEAPNFVWIARFRVIRPRTMAALASLLRRFLPLQRLQVCGSREALVGILVATLADFRSHVLSSIRLPKTAGRLSAACPKE
jgi:hypothetical protein